MFSSRSKKMVAMVIPPSDSGSSSEDESELGIDEQNEHEIDRLLAELDKDIENNVNFNTLVIYKFILVLE